MLPADGAFYLYVDVGDFTSDSVAFTKEMLNDIGVAATPGVDFDAERGSRYVRFCYAGTTADMAEGRAPAERVEPPRALQACARGHSKLTVFQASCRLADSGVRAQPGLRRVLHGGFGHEGRKAFEDADAYAAGRHALRGSGRAGGGLHQSKTESAIAAVRRASSSVPPCS